MRDAQMERELFDEHPVIDEEAARKRAAEEMARLRAPNAARLAHKRTFEQMTLREVALRQTTRARSSQ